MSSGPIRSASWNSFRCLSPKLGYLAAGYHYGADVTQLGAIYREWGQAADFRLGNAAASIGSLLRETGNLAGAVRHVNGLCN